MESIARQCREAFYVGEKGGNDLTLDRIGDTSDSANTDPTRGVWGLRGLGSKGADQHDCAVGENTLAAVQEEEAARVVELTGPIR